jgi:hypothetical protein
MGGLDTLLHATKFEQIGLIAVLVTSIAALIYAWMLAREVLKEDPGTQRMQDISNAIRTGAIAYLNKQMEVVIPLSIVLAILLYFTAHLADAPLSRLAWALSVGHCAWPIALAPSLACWPMGWAYWAAPSSLSSTVNMRRRCFWVSALEALFWQCLCVWAAAFIPRPLMWVLTWSAKLKWEFRKMIRATLP